jgi:hypothetical protein
METINERVFRLLGDEHGAQKRLADFLNRPDRPFSNKTITAWKVRNSKIPSELIPDIAEFLKTTTQYLLTGVDEAPVYKDHDTDRYADRLFNDPKLRMLLDATEKLDKDDIDLLVQFAKKMKGTRED